MAALADRGTLAIVGRHTILSWAMAHFTSSLVRRRLALALVSVVAASWLGAGGRPAAARCPQALKFVDGLGYERVREGHLRCHPSIDFPLDAFLSKKNKAFHIRLECSKM